MAVIETSGFIDSHSHLRGSSLSSQGVNQCENLEEALLRFAAMTGADSYDDAFVACNELLLGGVTGVQFMFHVFGDMDHYQSELSKTLRAISDSGIRALVILGITDQAEYLPTSFEGKSPLPDWVQAKRGLSSKQLGEIYQLANTSHPNINFGLGPVGPQWCSDQLLQDLGELATAGMRIHSHLLESTRQRNWCGENPLDRLVRFGLLGPKTSLAHCVWCNEQELGILAEHGAQLVTCPGSNQILGAGTANLAGWEQAGVDFGFGLDSSAEHVEPFKIASSFMSRDLALNALTQGGIRCTELATDQDRVVWEDNRYENCLSVSVAEVELVAGGVLRSAESHEAAKQRMAQALIKDRQDRQVRISELDEIMPLYQRELDSFLA